MGKRRTPSPDCPYCGEATGLVSGKSVYPHKRELHGKFFFRCGPCDAYVGCHPGTKRALGTPANKELRRARMILHNERLDPIWLHAETCGAYDPEDGRAISMIRNRARHRVYAWLAEQLGISRDECHTAQFDLDRCRAAWIALKGVQYIDIRAWGKEREAEERRKAA